MIVPLLSSPHLLLKYLVTIERHGVQTRPRIRSNKLTVDADSVVLRKASDCVTMSTCDNVDFVSKANPSPWFPQWAECFRSNEGRVCALTVCL